jgi:hypothetical protein
VHFAVAGVSFGPYDTVFGVAGLLFLIGGLASIAPMRRAGRPATGEAAAADHTVAAADATTTAETDTDGPTVAAAD